MTWRVVVSVALLCFALRVAAPLLLWKRGGSVGLVSRLDRAVPALLAALLAEQLLVASGRIVVDSRAAGVAAAGIAYLWRRSFVAAMVAAATVTALMRVTVS